MTVRQCTLITALTVLLLSGEGAAQDAPKPVPEKKTYLMKSSNASSGPGGVMGFFGDGQTLVQEGVLLTSGTVKASSAASIQVSANGVDKTFRLTPKTRLCADDKPTKASAFKVGDGVSIVSNTDEKDAISVRKGLVFMSMTSGRLLAYDCK
jgi:hypothetical protein